MKFEGIGFVGVALLALGCGVSSTGNDTGGVPDVQGDCSPGVAVVLTDYASSQIALSDLAGETQSESFISTGSAQTDGLAFAISGDVVLPSAATDSGQVVLLDRFGTNVVTWIDVESAEVRNQLAVGSGFESNPQDYVEVGGDRAFLSRWGQNQASGAEAFDSGGDVVVLDLAEPAITRSIPMPTADDLPARPSSLVRLGDEVVVTLDRTALDFATTGETMLVGLSIATQSVVWSETLRGLKGCGRLTLSPDGQTLALACTGALAPSGEVESLDQSALLLFDAEARPLREVARFKAEDIVGESLQEEVVFGSDRSVLLKTQTPWGGATNNRWLALDLESGESQVLLEASADADGKGKGLVFGGMSCAPGCSSVCLLADADAGVLQRAELGEGERWKLLPEVVVEERVGLPPRGLSPR